MADETSREKKLERLQRLQAQLDAQANAINEAMVGTTQRVLVESASRRNDAELAARTGNNHVVNFPGSESLLHTFVELRITAALAHSLRGELS